jgi:DNA ligase (NAD+)
MNNIEKIKKLVVLLNKASDAYYNTGDTIMEDREFDALMSELRGLEQKTGFVMAISPTQNVGYEVKSELPKVKHNHPMLSLDKTKSLNDIIKFLGDREFVAMPKMDGLSCSLCYLGGQLVSAETRGNGEIGESVIHCAKVVKNIPLQISYKEELIVDGEMIIADNDFQTINSTLPDGEKYKNSRNLVSGSIRQLDSSIAAQRNMRFIAWKCVTPVHTGDKYETRLNNCFDWRLRQLEKLGFEVVYHMQERIPRIRTFPQYRSKDSSIALQDIVQLIQDWADERGYPLDGCVFGYDDIAYGESLGATNHHLRSQYAFKFTDEVYSTKLKYVDWTIGKSSQLTPTAVFDSVNIDGADITRASLHNIGIIKSLGLTNNCTVNVIRANQVIPQVESCINDGDGEIEIPSTCPVCGGKTVIKKDNESEVLICTNPNCAGKKLAQFTHFVSKKGMDIKNLSEATLSVLISHGYIKSFKDIYHLKEYANKITQLDGFGQKSVEKLLQSIEKSRSVKLENFIAALGIPNIGLSGAKIISNYFHGNYNEFIQAYNNKFNWTMLEDFGAVMAESINSYLHDHLEEINELAEEMNFVLPEERRSDDATLNGLRFCITGSFSQSRDKLKERLEAKGARFVSGVSKNLDVLFCGERAGSKLTKAQSLGVKVAYEDELIELLEE